MLSPDAERTRLIGEVALRLARGDSPQSVADYLHRFEEEVNAAARAEGRGRGEARGGDPPGAGDPG